jgi:TfoX/Sxy family transcriptional regulator of competence genes
MAFDEHLGDRIRRILGTHPALTERRMFGGLAFMLEGRMFCGVIGEDLMVRVGPDAAPKLLARPHVRPMDFTGRPMRGYVYVAPEGCGSEKDLSFWLEAGARFVETGLDSAPAPKAAKPSLPRKVAKRPKTEDRSD